MFKKNTIIHEKQVYVPLTYHSKTINLILAVSCFLLVLGLFLSYNFTLDYSYDQKHKMLDNIKELEWYKGLSKEKQRQIDIIIMTEKSKDGIQR